MNQEALPTKYEEELARKVEELMNAEDYEQALTIVSKLIDIRNDYHVSYLWLGDCYRNLGQFDKALDSYNKALEFDGKCYDIVNLRNSDCITRCYFHSIGSRWFE